MVYVATHFLRRGAFASFYVGIKDSLFVSHSRYMGIVVEHEGCRGVLLLRRPYFLAYCRHTFSAFWL